VGEEEWTSLEMFLVALSKRDLFGLDLVFEDQR
jgi:hypothetical protein